MLLSFPASSGMLPCSHAIRIFVSFSGIVASKLPDVYKQHIFFYIFAANRETRPVLAWFIAETWTHFETYTQCLVHKNIISASQSCHVYQIS
jgi:hypothetical protein